jgi:hypothetical protein
MSILPDSWITFAERSDIIDVEHLRTGILAIIIGVPIMLEIPVILDLFRAVDQIQYSVLLVGTVCKGMAGGMVTHYAYSTTDRSFKIAEGMKSKEDAVKVVVAVSLAVGFLIGPGIDRLISNLELVVVQGGTLALLSAFLYLHLLISDWKLENEWPHVLAGLFVLTAPYIAA